MIQKRVLVTGSAKRLGHAMAVFLAHRGFDVAVHYASAEEEALATVNEIQSIGRVAVALRADLLREDQVDQLVGKAAEGLGGPLNLLINNASIFENDEIGSITSESWDRHIGSNLRAPVFLTQAFAKTAPEPVIDKNGEPVSQAMVVNMLDQRVRKLTPAFTSYTIAKSGLWVFTQTAAQALAPKIRVNAIAPGPTLIGARQSPEHFAKQRANTILERGANKEDITGALGYFLDAPTVTGQMLCIDGGQHLGWKTADILGLE